MSLKELEKDIQNRDSKLSKRAHDQTVYDEWQSKTEDDQVNMWQKMKDKMIGTRINAVVIGGIIISVIIVLVLGALSFMYFQKGFFAQERVVLAMEASESIGSNILTEILFSYENDNRSDLNGAEIVVRFGEYFMPAEDQAGFTRVSDSQGVINIGTISGHQNGSFSLVGQFVGPRSAVGDVSGMLRYTPERTTARYDVTARAATTITSSPITIDIESPIEIVNGNLMDIAVKIQNTSTNELSQLKFVFDAPEGFSLSSAEPRASHSNVWLIDHVAPQSEMIIHIRGGLDAPIGSIQSFHAEVGTQEGSNAYISYANETYAPRITQSPITVHQTIIGNDDSAVYAGEQLRYKVTFTNDSATPLRDAIVTVNIDSTVLNFATLELGDAGDYDQANHRIIWKASDVPALKVLEPRESGELFFSVPVVENFSIQDVNDHHFSITSVASIDSVDIPSMLRENKTVLSNVLTVSVAGKVILTSTSEYVSDAKILKVGEKTVYKVTMKIDSINNDITETTVHIPLPTHTTFEGTDAKELTYNERTNELTWDVGTVTHGAGIISDPATVSFNVGIVPSVDQIGTIPVLVKEQILSAMDQFADVQVKEKASAIRTDSDGRSNVEGLIQP